MPACYVRRISDIMVFSNLTPIFSSFSSTITRLSLASLLSRSYSADLNFLIGLCMCLMLGNVLGNNATEFSPAFSSESTFHIRTERTVY